MDEKLLRVQNFEYNKNLSYKAYTTDYKQCHHPSDMLNADVSDLRTNALCCGVTLPMVSYWIKLELIVLKCKDQL